MNDLSWFIYLADVLGSIKTLFMIVGIVALVLSTFFLCVCADYCSDDWWYKLLFKAVLPLSFLLVLLACFLPSSTTMYAIAASEMGEKVINTPTAGKAVKALDAWLDKQITDIKEDDDKE